jgi:hypothetical protein
MRRLRLLWLVGGSSPYTIARTVVNIQHVGACGSALQSKIRISRTATASNISLRIFRWNYDFDEKLWLISWLSLNSKGRWLTILSSHNRFLVSNISRNRTIYRRIPSWISQKVALLKWSSNYPAAHRSSGKIAFKFHVEGWRRHGVINVASHFRPIKIKELFLQLQLHNMKILRWSLRPKAQPELLI